MSAARGLRIAYAFSIAILLLIAIYLYLQSGITGNVVYEEATIHADFSAPQDTVSPQFFGVNTHGSWMTSPQWIHGGGTADTTWHQEKLLGANLTFIRADMSLEYTTPPILNMEVEDWLQTSGIFDGSSQSVGDLPVAWQAESVQGTGTISQASRDGGFAVSINNTGASGSVFSKKSLGTLPIGKSYEFKVWVKSTYPVVAHIQRMDTWGSGCRATHSGSGAWEELICTMTPSDTAEWRLVIETRQGESLLWDNASFTQDGTPYSARRIISSSENARQLLAWAHEQNIKVLYIASYMPPHLANQSANCASNVHLCAPADPAAYADLVVQFINESTNDGQYADALEIEVWNEPDLEMFWLPDDISAARYAQYNAMYAAVYDAVKAAYPQVAVGGPAITTIQDPTRGGPFMESFLAEHGDKMDFFSFHRYLDSGDYDATLQTEIDLIMAACARHNANCSRIVFDEFNVRSTDVKLNDPGEHAKQLAIAYAYLLNTMPENITTAQYQWSESRPYRDGIGYPEYPQRWSMVSEPALDNALYASYNVTKDFATYHSAGSTVVESTSADPQVRIVASYKGDDRYVTIINGKNVATPVTLGLAGVNASAVIDLKTNLSYPVVDSVVDLGAFAPAQIRHFRVLDADVPISETGLNETPLNNSVNETNLTNETGLNESLNLTIDGQANGTGANESINESEGSLNESPQEPPAPAQIDVPIRISRGGGGGGAPKKALNATLNVSANSTAADLTQAGDRSETGAQRKSPPSQERKTAVVTEEYERAVLYESELMQVPQESTLELPAVIRDDKMYWALVAGCASLIGYLAYHRAKRPRHL